MMKTNCACDFMSYTLFMISFSSYHDVNRSDVDSTLAFFWSDSRREKESENNRYSFEFRSTALFTALGERVTIR